MHNCKDRKGKILYVSQMQRDFEVHNAADDCVLPCRQIIITTAIQWSPQTNKGKKRTHTQKKTKKQNGHNVLNPFPKKMSREKAAKITDSMVN